MSDPNEALQTLLNPAGIKTSLFPPTSRYSGIDTATRESCDGQIVIYLRRRFVPSPEKFALLHEHVVTEGERLDNISARYLGDPEQFWRLCDANGALRPQELTETIGRHLRITLPEGMPGLTNA
ncbi:MAG: LysM domain-containing protein [Verrucomicrobiota bacterium]|nr:LysM domain-containing protein [Verrucomicrobiota bacterium]